MKQNMPPAEPAPTFEDLYAEHEERVRRLLRMFGVTTDQDRQDAAQEVWLDVHRSLASFDPQKGTERAWVAGIARNAARDHRRTRQRRPEFSTPAAAEPVTTRTAEEEAQEQERREALWSFYERAVPNQDQRVAFLLHEIEGMTVEEVAQATSARPCTVRWRIAMARRKLKEQMTEEERRKLLAILPVMSVDAFVRAMRETKFPDGESARVWERVTARIEAEGGSVHDRLGAPETATTPSPKGYTFTGPRLASAAAAVFLLGALSGAAVHSLLTASVGAKVTAIDAEVAPLAPPKIAPPPEPAPSPSAAPSSVPSAAPNTSNAPAMSSSSWQSEAWILNRARAAEAAEALELTDQHARRFPGSQRAAAREEIAIRALVQLGRREEAEKRGVRLLSWAPQKRPAIEAVLGRRLF